jgi:putative membrane protein
MVRLILRLTVNAVALYVTTLLNLGISFNGQWWQLVIVAFIFGLVNAVIRPVLNFFTCPLILLTLGLFTLVVNGLMLYLTAGLSNYFNLGFHITDFWAALIGGLVVSLISFVLNIFVRDANGGDHH